jgi:hypothetical protein
MTRAAVACCACVGAGLAFATEPVDEPLWGDTHVHTSYSQDAFLYGNLSADPETAYRFARGMPVLHPVTQARVRLRRPLDFLVVSDHAEVLGVAQSISRGDPRMLELPAGRTIFELIKAGKFSEALRTIRGIIRSSDATTRASLNAPAVQADNWAHIAKVADAYNDPGRFTTFIGWEWTANSGGANLHRVIISTATAQVAQTFRPFSAVDSTAPEDLWAFLDATSRATHAQFIAIPHNSNVSRGKMFDTVDSNGRALTQEYARIRARWEPLVEVTQTKGTSETHGLLSPNDEFATFEFFPTLLSGTEPATITPGDYVRGALLRGLQLERTLGANPFKLGMLGSTDTHIALSSEDDADFHGKLGADALPKDKSKPLADGALYTGWDLSASGRAAVWAKRNTREEIMAAFQRREVYGTTGPRITLRFFGGFTFSKSDAQAKNFAEIGHRKGVPMGADLTQAPAGRAPSFLIRAVKDPDAANLDRVQVVKGWLDASGNSHEKVFDVAWSGDRKPDAAGNLPEVGNTVDVRTCRYLDTIGAAQLAVVWTDPEFDARYRAFYYVRVLQIPTARHSLYDAIALGIDPAATGHPATIQERAYSSPIWYTP